MKVFKDIFFEVFHAVIPLASVVFVLQLVVVGSPRVQILQFLVGLLFVILGLFLFMVGLRVGILPILRSHRKRHSPSGEVITDHLLYLLARIFGHRRRT